MSLCPSDVEKNTTCDPGEVSRHTSSPWFYYLMLPSIPQNVHFSERSVPPWTIKRFYYARRNHQLIWWWWLASGYIIHCALPRYFNWISSVVWFMCLYYEERAATDGILRYSISRRMYILGDDIITFSLKFMCASVRRRNREPTTSRRM